MVWQNESVDCVSLTGQGFSKKRKTGRAWQWLIWFQSYLCPRLAPSRIMMQSSNMGERRPHGAPANAAVAEWWPGSRRVPYAQYPPSSTPVPTQREVRPLRPHQRPEHEVRVAAGPDGRRRITAAAAAAESPPPPPPDPDRHLVDPEGRAPTGGGEARRSTCNELTSRRNNMKGAQGYTWEIDHRARLSVHNAAARGGAVEGSMESDHGRK